MNLKKIIIISFALLICFSIYTQSNAAKKAKIIKEAPAPAPVYAYIPQIIKINENINIPKGTIVDSAISFGGNINIAGEVIKDAISFGGSIILKPGGTIHGNAAVIGGILRRAQNSKIGGDIMEVTMPQQFSSIVVSGAKLSPVLILIATAFASLLAFVGILCIGVSAGLFFPKRIGWTSVTLERHPCKSFWWGVLFTILAGPIAFLLCVSVIGIPLILVQIIVYGLAIILGYISFLQMLGKKFLGVFRKMNKPMVTEIIWGTVILALIGLIPAIGALINCIVCTMGLGASWMSKLGAEEA